MLRANREQATCKRCSKLGELNSFYGKTHTKEARQRMSHSGTDNPFYGRRHSKETRRKMRLAVIHRKELGMTVYPRYNPKACKLIEEYGKQHGYNFQHAENGGEYYVKGLGYWVDGYDEEKNTVIEYYEPRHRNQTEHDEDRQREIETHLNCEFIIISG